MKWKKLSARNFGPLSHWKADIDSPVTVFLGHNEAGKSTLMELMCALLFGQRRRRDEVNALISWGHSQANLEGEILRDNGEEAHIARIYQNGAVSGTLTEAGQSLDIAGEPLSWVNPMNRELYRDVFALSLDDLIFPGQDAWSESQDRVLTGQFGQELRPAQEVSQELFKEAMSLWRPDHRGKTRMETLDEEISVTAAALEAARAREQRCQALGQEAAALEAQLQALQGQEAEWKAREAQLSALAEPMERMRQARDMEQRAAGTAALNLPDDPEALLTQAQEERSRLTARIGETGRRLAETHIRLERVGENELLLLEHAGELEALKRAMEAEAPQVAEASQEARRARDEYLKANLLDEKAPAGYLPEELDRLANRASQSQSRLAQSQLAYQEKWNHFSSGTTPVLIVLGVLSLIVGVLLCPIVPLLSKFAAWPLCFAGAGIGLLLLVLTLPVRAAHRRHYIRSAQEELESANEQAKAEGLALREAWSDFSLSQENSSLDKLIAHSMDAAQLDHALRQADAQLSAVTAAENALTADCRTLCAVLHLEDEDNPRQQVLNSAARLEDIRLWQREEPLLREQLQQLRITLEEEKARLQSFQDQERNLLALLAPMPGATQAEKLRQLKERSQWAKQAQALRASLQGQDLPDPEYYHQEVQENNQRLDENAARQRQLSHDLGICQQGIKELSGQETALPLQEQLNAQMKQRDEMARQRDRLAAMSCLVEIARNRYQQENQNEIIGKASSYLSRITDGRYSRLMMTDDRKGVRIYSAEAGGFLDPAKDRLSKGTREQIYLSLRLGLIDHLDPQGETLPLILDETFVNWDQDRLERGISLFRELTRQRQVFAFTCHDWMARAMADSGCETKIVRLP